MQRITRHTGLIFGLIVVVYAVYAALFIFHNSFVVDGTRYFSLFDDAMGPMRIARHLADGFGPVWNIGGERFEEYPNLLWVGYLAVLHLLRIPMPVISGVVQASGAVCLALNLIFVKKAADLLGDNNPLVSLGAVFITAFFLPLNMWGLLGTEVAVLAMLITAASWKVLQGFKTGTFSALPYVLLGVASLFRLDAAIPFTLALVFAIVSDRAHRRSHLLWGGGLFLIFIGGQSIFRLAYYGTLLTNTYHLNFEGPPAVRRLIQGAETLWGYFVHMGPVFYLAVASLLVLRRDRMVLFLMLIVGGQAAYSLFIGGDGWEFWGGTNHYVTVVMPEFFLLFCVALKVLYEQLVRRAARLRPAYVGAAVLVFGVAGFLNFNAIRGLDGWSEALLRIPSLHVPDNEDNLKQVQVLLRITKPEARITTKWSGTVPYFAERVMYDILGKNDQVIARLPPQPKVKDFYPNHMKWSYEYSIGQMQPDVVVQLWTDPENAQPYLAGSYVEIKVNGFSWYLRKDSPNILWDQVPTQ